MGAGDLFRKLDSRVLPPLVHGVTRLGEGPARLRLLSTAALLSVAAVLVAAVWAAERRPGVGDPTVGDVVRVGVIEGQSIPGYVASSRGELAALLTSPPAGGTPVETYALVTLSAYLAPDALPPVLDGVAVAEVFARVPLPGVQTQIMRIPAFRVPDDVAAGMTEAAGRKDREAANYHRLSAALRGDGEQERRLREVYDGGADVATTEAAAYRARCACVYAAVVRATPAALDRITSRAQVRAVDPAPEVRRLDRAVFLPPLPEQDDVARPPADEGVPPAPAPSEQPRTSPGITTSPQPMVATSAPVTVPSPAGAGSAPPPSPTPSMPSATPHPATTNPPAQAPPG